MKMTSMKFEKCCKKNVNNRNNINGNNSNIVAI